MTHGWPGSVIELLRVVGPLTDPPAHGGRAEDAFDLVLPSLPGYGFSAEPAELGWGVGRVAHAWAELMHRLGYTRYVAQGGDVGAAVTDAMGRQAPEGLLGEALADGRLTVDEHRERIDVLYATRTLDELAPLTADLGTGRRDVERQRSAAQVERVAPQVAILSSSMARPTGRVEGGMVAFAFLGDARIDLTHASFGENGVEITARAILGVVNIVVPPDARVTMTGFPLVGSLSPTREPGPADGPHVKVSALALFGEVTIHRAEAKADDD